MAVDVHSGLAGITHWLNDILARSGYPEVKFEKSDPVIAAMKQSVDKIYDNGRNTTMSNEELLSILHSVAPAIRKMIN